MEIESIKRVAYWSSFLVFLVFLAVIMTAERLSVIFKIIIVVLLAFLSARFRLEDKYSFLSMVLVLFSGVLLGAVIAEDSVQFWVFAFLYVILFFASCEVIERNLLGV